MRQPFEPITPFLSRYPTHGDRDADDADKKHLNAEEGGFISFDGLRFHVDYLSGDAAPNDAYADSHDLGLRREIFTPHRNLDDTTGKQPDLSTLRNN